MTSGEMEAFDKFRLTTELYDLVSVKTDTYWKDEDNQCADWQCSYINIANKIDTSINLRSPVSWPCDCL